VVLDLNYKTEPVDTRVSAVVLGCVNETICLFHITLYPLLMSQDPFGSPFLSLSLSCSRMVELGGEISLFLIH
jgi:hypothetical protein